MTIVKNKIHDNKPKNKKKHGTIIEKTKTITILKSKVKKQLNDNGDSSDLRRQSKEENVKKIQNTTTHPLQRFIHLKPYLTLTIKLMVHFDSILTNRLFTHTNRSKLIAKLRTAEILQEVRSIFAASALRVNIIFHLNDVKFLKSSNAVPMEANAIKYLEGYCRWQGQFKAKDHYYSILLTGLDIVHYDISGKKSKKNSGKCNL